jgi:hypothetical protein
MEGTGRGKVSDFEPIWIGVHPDPNSKLYSAIEGIPDEILDRMDPITRTLGRFIRFMAKQDLGWLGHIADIPIAGQGAAGLKSAADGLVDLATAVFDQVVFGDPIDFLDILPPQVRGIMPEAMEDAIHKGFDTSAGKWISDLMMIWSGVRLGTPIVRFIKNSAAMKAVMRVAPTVATAGLSAYLVGRRIEMNVKPLIEAIENSFAAMTDSFTKLTEGIDEEGIVVNVTNTVPEGAVKEEDVVEDSDSKDGDTTTIAPPPVEPPEVVPDVPDIPDIPDIPDVPDVVDIPWSDLIGALGRVGGGAASTLFAKDTKGGGGSGPARDLSHCPLVIERAIKAKDLNSIPPECMPLFREVQSEASKGDVNGRIDRKKGGTPSKKFSWSDRRGETTRRENTFLGSGTSGLDNLWS